MHKLTPAIFKISFNMSIHYLYHNVLSLAMSEKDNFLQSNQYSIHNQLLIYIVPTSMLSYMAS